MKDEEMAEEYLQSIEGDDCVIITDRKERKEAFLAGLKAGRPQWHDLRKDPNDLPKGNYSVLVIIDYLALGKEYSIRENLKEDSKGIIAWCEIPQFKENE